MIISRKLLLLSTLILALVSISWPAPGAQAQSIPKLVDTAEYIELNNYVIFLKGQSATPTSAETISTYRSNLSSRVSGAEIRLEALFQRHKTATNNSINKKRKKAVTRARNKERQRLQKAAKKKQRGLGAVKNAYQQQMNKIEQKYDRRISALEKTIKKLKRDRNKTRNPRKLAIINDRIEESRVLIQNLSEDRQAAVKRAEGQKKSATEKVRAAFRQQKAKIKGNAKRQVSEIIADYQQRREKQMNTNRSRRTADQSKVNKLNDQGTVAIDAIPPLLPPDPDPPAVP